MTTAMAPADRTVELERKIDALTEQVAFLAAEATSRQQQREQYEELLADVTPLAGEAMAVATRQLEELRTRGDLANLIHLMTRLVEVAPTLDRMLVMVDSFSELAADATPMAGDAMALASDRLAELDRRGYFEFASAGLGVLDRVVTNYSKDDVDQLGDNIVTMLDTIKELTQPEMLVLIQHVIDGLQRQKSAITDESAEPPSLWTLARKLRDPEVRKGMARALNTLAAVSAETGPETMQEITTTHQKEA